MALTTETFRILIKEYLGVEFSDAELERLRPVVERQIERMRELHTLDLGGEDPRTIHYIVDQRLMR